MRKYIKHMHLGNIEEELSVISWEGWGRICRQKRQGNTGLSQKEKRGSSRQTGAMGWGGRRGVPSRDECKGGSNTASLLFGI